MSAARPRPTSWRPFASGILAPAFSAALALSLAAQAKPFTLEQVLGAPFPDQLVSAPSGGALAWGFDLRGARNVWAALPPEYKARQLTRFDKDDGQEISGLQLTADGQSVVFVRGGDPNGRHEFPNPTSEASGIQQAVWIAPVSGGAARQLAEGSSPAVSPDGKMVAFVKDGAALLVSTSGGDSAKPLFKARGAAGSLRWSPDGTKLVFVSQRSRHAFIGVYDRTANAIRWLDPSVDNDAEPVWSPDGTRVAFLRIPASFDDFEFAQQRTGEPWSLRVADVATGAGREVWRAKPGTGSVFRGLDASWQLLWGAGDRLVFPWEREGWTHLYSVSARGGEATLLTPGEFEVEHVALEPGGGSVIFSSNQGDIDRRHLWRVAVGGGGAPEAVTTGTGIEWSPAPLGQGRIAYLGSDARGPARVQILSPGRSQADLAPETVPADFPAKALVTPEPVLFRAADGMTIHAQLFKPADLKPGERRPAVVFFHGGSRRQMLLGWHYMYYYHNAYGMNQYLAQQGYVVLAVNYRSGIGYGMQFREALNYGAGGASEFNDVIGAGLYLQSRADVDPKKIGLWGGSYGGYLTALGLSRASDLFAAGVDLHGVHDWNKVIENFVPAYDPRVDQERARLALASSPLASVSTWRSPVLLIHGDDDRNVPFTETVSLAAALRKQGVEFEELVFPDEVHDFLLHRDWLAAYHAAVEFLDRKLKH
jgi:dipeptidyl aminopeptidase/acylaminoacyl peptidase